MWGQEVPVASPLVLELVSGPITGFWLVVGIAGQTNTLSDPPFHMEHNDAIIIGIEYC